MSKTSKKKSVKKAVKSVEKKKTKAEVNKNETKKKKIDIVEEQKKNVKDNKEITVGKFEIKESKEVGDIIVDNILPYGLSVIRQRACVELVDGFKPIQRKILYAMYKLGCFDKLMKSAAITGEIQGKYSPHADCYNSTVLLTEEEEGSMIPYTKGKGHFGKHYSENDLPAASRYTEQKLQPICHEFLDKINKHPDIFVDNYNKTLKEPKYLMQPYPNILCNAGGSQVAYAFRGDFGSFNLSEVCDATKIIINNLDKSNKILVKKIREVMPTMDFTTKGLTYINDEEIENIYENGYGQIQLRAVFNNDEKNKVLEIVEIPYTTTIENIINKIVAECSKKNTMLPEIKDVRDECSKGLKIAIDYKNGTDIEALKKKLYAITSCQSNVNVNMYLVYKSIPQRMGVVDCIKTWIIERRQWVETELKADLEELKKKLNMLEGLQKILLDIDKAIKIVRQSKTDEEVIVGLKKAFKIDDEQAEFIANIKLRNLNRDYILNKGKEIKSLKDQIKEVEGYLKNIDKKIIEDLDRIKKTYGQPRKTQIVPQWEDVAKVKEKVKEQAKVEAKEREAKELKGNSIVFCNENTVKRLDENSSAQTPSGYKKYNVANTDEILAFTNLGKVFKWQVMKFKSGSQTKISDINKINKKMQSGEAIIYTVPLIKDEKIVIVFENKKAVKFKASEYVTTSNKLCFPKGINIKNGSPIYIESIKEDKDISLNGKTINTKDIKECSSKTASGNKIKI